MSRREPLLHERVTSPTNAGGTRRSFLAGAAVAAGGLAWRGTHAWVNAETRPTNRSNETLSVGLIGCGGRGPYLGYLFGSQPNVRITAVCDVYDEHAEKAAELVGRIGHKPKLYRDYRRLLDDREIDAVVVATSIHWHVIPAIAACAAGKDVYLEKPVGMSVAEGRAAVEAVKRYGRIVQMGTQQHTWPHYREAVEIIRSGGLGEISQVHVWDTERVSLGSPPNSAPPAGLDWDFWLGPGSQRAYNRNRQFHHDWFFDHGGGWQLAWGVHHFDIVHWAMGVDAPLTASATGGKWAFADDNREWPDTFVGACAYPAGPVAKSGFLMNYTCRTGSSRPIENCRHGKAFYGTNGVMVLSRAGFKVYPDEQGEPAPARTVTTRQSEHEVVIDHVRGFLECVRTRKQPEASIEVGHRASNPGHLMNIAWRTGRKIEWDAAKERIPGDAEASRLLSREYRAGYELPA